MSCHDETPGTTLTTAPTVVLVGNPNVGKSTLFNSLTGSRQKVTNAPGTTVELHVGAWRGLRTAAGDERRVDLVDLPGTYSLLARSPDEHVAADAIAGRGHAGPPALAVVLVEAAALARSLYLLGQVGDLGVDVVVALTMTDVARSRGVVVDADRLARVLGVGVVAIDPRTGDGLSALGALVARTLADGPSRLLLPPRPLGQATESQDHLFDWVDAVVRDLELAPPAGTTASDRVDRVLLDPRVGIPAFLAVMWLLFQLSTAAAAPLMGAVDQVVNGWGADALGGALGALGAPGWLEGLLVDGLLAGLGTVLSFAPLMALMFLAVGVLEDSGYLARAAFVADRAMRTIGLDGRAMLPFVIGFGCNLPALAATRTLPHARQRLLAGLLVPFTSCTARLTVYILLASVFFPGDVGTAVFTMYVASIALVVLGGLALRGALFRDLRREPLLLALPAYQRPRLRSLATSTGVRVRGFVTKAGRIIVVTLLAVWVLMSVPVTGGHAFADVPVEASLYGSTARAVAPVLAPLGVDDWHVAAALATGFVAKEVVVGSLAQSFAVDEPEDPGAPGDLGSRLRATLERTSGGHPGPAAAALMVFVLAYTPCLATVAEQRRLFGARWTGGAVAAQLTLAWLLAAAVFGFGRLL